MILSLAEQRTAQFYDWELRCRGWDVYSVPVALEPTFVPFFFQPAAMQQIDDGLRPTLISMVADLFTGKKQPTQESTPQYDTDLDPFPYISDAPLQVLHVSLPKGRKVDPKEMDCLLCMLSYCGHPVSFEIIASHTSIVIQIVCRESDFFHVQGQIKAFFPDSIVHEKDDSFMNMLDNPTNYIYTVDFGLSEEFTRPIATADSFKLDPFIGLFGTLENLDTDESILIQILFQGTVNPWAESIIHSVTGSDGKSFFADAPEMLDLAHEKTSSPLFGVTIRVVTQAPTEQEAGSLIESVNRAVAYLSRSNANVLLPLATEAYSFELRLQDVGLRQSRRQGMILNSRELATLVHFPSDSVVSAKLNPDTRKTKAVPEIAQGHKLVLGINTHSGVKKVASVADIQRLKHMHVIGATGTGKSTFLLNLISQDIENGNGIAVLDPHGDLIESILSHIPEDRHGDVMIIDPSDSEFPVGFNILSAHSEIEKDILSSDLVAAFRRLSTSWGDQMNSVLANAILAFLESDKGGTLVDLRRFLIEKPFRDLFLKSVKDPSITYYWQKEYPLLKSNSIGSILTRLDTFLRPKLIRNMVAQKSGPDFEHILNTKKILLVKLPQGLIGAENSYLLGTFIVAKINQAAMARQVMSKADRTNFFLYLDEFQNFITPSISTILSGARKYNLGLILAHQDMQQLASNSELASSVLANAGTRVCFRIGDADAKKVEHGFSFFEGYDLQNLNTGEAIVRIDRPEYDFNISIPYHPTEVSESSQIAVITKSRNTYGTPKSVIEEQLRGLQEEIREPVQEMSTTPTTTLKEKEPLPKAEVKHVQQEILAVKIPPEKKTQSQHRYLQILIKKMAEARGYKASIEDPLPNGGRVDVSLERNGKKIAVEISVTSTDIYEVHNVEKCLAAGYDLVIECSMEPKTLENIRKAAEQNLSSIAKVLFLDPDALFLFLDTEIAKDASSEKLMKGYRVKVEYDAVSENIMNKKKENILNTIANSLRKNNNLKTISL